MSFEEWKDYKLGEIVEVAQGLAINAKTKHLIQENGLPLLRITDLINNTEVQYINPDGAPKQCVSNSSDLIYTRTGQVGLVFKGRVGVIHNNCFKVIPDVSKVDSNYLYWFLYKDTTREIANSIASGSVQKDLPHSAFKSIEISLPPINIQRKIASILSSLDDKIELNRQTNQTLESIAQAIFKQWFVNFNFPGATGEMQVSELGNIPKNWKVGNLGDVCDLVYGKALKAENRIAGYFPVVGSSGIVGSHNEYLVEAPGIVIGRKGTIGEVTWLHENFYPIDTTYYIVDKINSDGLFYHYFLLKSQDFKKIASDSAVPGLNRNQALLNQIIIPELDLIKSFNQINKTLFYTIHNNEQQIKTLTQLRDNLLPKLMRKETDKN
jgi:type I restriction enzyme S subunit